MEKSWDDGTKKFVVVSVKYPTQFQFSEALGTITLRFYSQGFTEGGFPMNDLFEGRKEDV